MSFLTPTLALVTAAIAVPALVVLYFLKLRRRDVEVSSTLLWKKAIEDLQANAPFQRLRRNILLLLQLLALSAALFALAQPRFEGTQSPGQRHVVLIDRSASMQSADDDPAELGKRTRLEQAKRDALILIDSLREPDLLGEGGDQAMVIAFDASAVVLAQFTSNKPELRRVIESIEPSDAPTSIRDAVRLARAQAQKRVQREPGPDGKVETRVVGTEAIGTIHIFSDGALPDLVTRSADSDDASQDSISPDDVVVYHPVGTPSAWNIGVTSLRAERAFDDPSNLSVFVGLQSTAPAAKTVEVALSIEGRLIASKDVILPAASPSSPPPIDAGANAPPPAARLIPAVSGVVFSVPHPEGGVVSVAVRVPESQHDDHGPALAVDDFGYLVVPPARRLALAMVSDGNLFLKELLDGLVLARPLKVVPTAQGQAFLSSAEAAAYDVVILDRWLPKIKNDAGADVPGLPPGRFLINGAIPPPPLGVLDKGSGEATVVLDWRRDHPVLRGLSLDSLVVSPAPRVEIPAGSAATAMALGEGGPLIVEASDPARRTIFLTFDLNQSTWPFDPPSFVVFVVRSLEYLAAGAADSGQSTLRPGGTLSTRLPAGASGPRVVLPDSTSQSLVSDPSGEVNFAPVQRVGIYTLAWTGPLGPSDVRDGSSGARRALAANLLDPAESDVAARPTIEVSSNAQVLRGSTSEGLVSLWPWLLLAMLAVLMFEWWVYNRKVTF